MVTAEKDTLLDELEHYKAEQEKIRTVVGTIGGRGSAKRDKIINMVFLGVLIILFTMDILRHLYDFQDPLPPLLSLEIGLVLVSIKIIWMIHKQTKVEHFQFWILHSIEFRLNDLSKRFEAFVQSANATPAQDGEQE